MNLSKTRVSSGAPEGYTTPAPLAIIKHIYYGLLYIHKTPYVSDYSERSPLIEKGSESGQ